MKNKIFLFLIFSVLIFCTSVFAGIPKSGDPYYFYVGTYTGSGSEGIYIFSLDPRDGKLVNHGLASKSENPSFITLTQDGKFLLAVNETKDEQNHNTGYVESFLINKDDHHLILQNKVPSGGAHPCFVSVNEAGLVLAANYTGGNIALFKLGKSGKLSNYTDVQQHIGNGPVKARQSEPHVHSAFFEPNSKRIFVSDLGTDRVAVYVPDGNGSKLAKPAISEIKITPGSGPRHLAFHPKLKILYVVNELSNNISVISLNRDGSFIALETVSTLPAGFDKVSNCADIHISGDGKFVYASNRGLNSIAIFSVDPVNGKLLLMGQESTQGDTPRNFALSPKEDYILVANQNSEDIVSFHRDRSTGKLVFADKIKAFKPVCILFDK